MKRKVKQYKWKQCSQTVLLNKFSGVVSNYFNTIVSNAQKCLDHELNRRLFGINLDRPYRRGKNRCKRCGLKEAV